MEHFALETRLNDITIKREFEVDPADLHLSIVIGSRGQTWLIDIPLHAARILRDALNEIFQVAYRENSKVASQ